VALAWAATGCGGGDESSTTTSASTSSATTQASTTTSGNGERQQVGDGRGGVGLEQIGSFENPVYVTEPPSGDDGLYVVEQGGTIQRIPPDGGDPTLFLDISSQVTAGGEQGLLSVAFAPDYAKSGLLYVDFTGTDQDQHVVSYQRSDSGEVDPDSARELAHIGDFAPNHNGGLLLFGPDGELYLGMGDGGGAGDPERTAQNLDSPLGKLLRINRDKGGYEVAAYGLRNPWRYSFDRDTGDLWIGDVGQDSLEEIDAVTAKEFASGDDLNFGWSAFEGTERFNSDQQAPGAIEPIFEYSHDTGGCSVTGGYVVRGDDLPTLRGRYLYGDYCAGQLHSFTADPAGDGGDDRELGVEVPSLSSFGEDRDGHVYAISGSGPVYRLVAKG
jgi:glucose/arabinose dehydrogenase